jgi:hypothetical protein
MFRLVFVNAAEDVPRLVRAYGRACDGEFALVLRPTEERGVLVLVRKKDGASFWRAPSSPVETSDAPGLPTSPITAAEAVALARTEQKAVPKAGPITLRGQWTGTVACDGGAPRVELVRKLAAYGVLRIVSDPGVGWTWRVERTEKWFSRPGADTGTAHTLIKAIEGGLARAMGLLGEACSVRDSRRRAALDTAYAAEHPIKPAREGKDPTERFNPKEPPPAKARAATGGWARIEGEELPDAEPIERPSRAVKARLKAGGLVHDAGAGSYLGTLVAAFGGVAAGGLVFRPAEGGALFVGPAPVAAVAAAPPKRTAAAPPAPVAAPVPKKRQAAKAESEPDAAKDKALIDAFSAAIASAMNGV